ncbi:hypothetical protein JW979_05735 [bacterium]|nr:hypothetical protein [candidate division CSSED10-310 bacterium]
METETSVTGIIVPVNYDKDYNAVSIMLFTDEEQEFLIELSNIGYELLHQLRRLVKISGTIRKNNTGRNTISVRRYEILDSY